MKTCLAVLLLTAAAAPAVADETVTRMDDPGLDLGAGLGKQINIRFSGSFARDRLARSDFDGVVLSDVQDGKVCIFGRDQGLDPKDAKFRAVVRADEGDICVPRGEISVRVTPQSVAAAPPVPFYSTDTAKCNWTWKTGKDIGVWAEDCSFDTGHWFVAYDAAVDAFTSGADQQEPYPVLRQFRVAAGAAPDALLPELKAKALVLDSADCQFAPATQQPAPKGWTAWEVVPKGKLKQDFDALPQDEVPEPPCGELGVTVDSIGFFMIHKDHPGRILYVSLGQDGTLIAPETITLQSESP